MEDPKDDKKEKESPELKEELTEDELKGVDGGTAEPNVNLDSSKWWCILLCQPTLPAPIL